MDGATPDCGAFVTPISPCSGSLINRISLDEEDQAGSSDRICAFVSVPVFDLDKDKDGQGRGEEKAAPAIRPNPPRTSQSSAQDLGSNPRNSQKSAQDVAPARRKPRQKVALSGSSLEISASGPTAAATAAAATTAAVTAATATDAAGLVSPAARAAATAAALRVVAAAKGTELERPLPIEKEENRRARGGGGEEEIPPLVRGSSSHSEVDNCTNVYGAPMQPHGSQAADFQSPLAVDGAATMTQQHLRYLHREQMLQKHARQQQSSSNSLASDAGGGSLGPIAQQLQQLQQQQQQQQQLQPSRESNRKRVLQSGHGSREYSSERSGEARATYCSSEEGLSGSGLRFTSRSGSKHSLGRNPSRTWGGSSGSDLVAWSVAALVGSTSHSNDCPGIGRLARQATAEEWSHGRDNLHPHFQSQTSSNSHTLLGVGETSSHASNQTAGNINYTSAAISNVAETEGGSAGGRSTVTSVNGIPIARRSVSGQTAASISGVKGKQLLGDIVRRKSRTSTGSESTFDQLSERVQTLVSFSGCEDLLRGSQLHSILKLAGRMLDPSVEHDVDPYDLSYNTDTIDHFISHNWAVGRWRKYLCLITYFNFWPAVYITMLYCALLSCLALTNFYPVLNPKDQVWHEYPQGFLCGVTAVPVFCLALFGLRELPVKGPTVFLDRACIHQEDSELQQRSIEKLGAFLCHSDMMVICYTDIYLTRLWTVYEVASFLALYPIRRMRVIPTILPIVLLAGMCLTYVLGSFTLLINEVVYWYYMEQSWMPVAWFCFGMICRGWAKSKQKIGERLSTFSVHNCNCFDPRDRPLVYANIAALMKETQGIPDEASEAEALDCFDALVREELPQALTLSLGPTCMRYSQTVVAATFNYIPRIIDTSVSMKYGLPLKTWFCAFFLWYMILVWCVTPICIVTEDAISHKFLHLTGIKEILFMFVGSMVTACAAAICLNVLDFVSKAAIDEEVGSFWMYIEIVLLIAGAILARMTFTSFCCRNRGRWHVPSPPTIITGRGSGQGSTTTQPAGSSPEQASVVSRDSDLPYFVGSRNNSASRLPRLARAATADGFGAGAVSRLDLAMPPRLPSTPSPLAISRLPIDRSPNFGERSEVGSKDTTYSFGPDVNEGMGQTRSLPELGSSVREDFFASATSSHQENNGSAPPREQSEKPWLVAL